MAGRGRWLAGGCRAEVFGGDPAGAPGALKRIDTTWTGVPVRDLLERAGVQKKAKFVMEHAEFGYTTNIPLKDITTDDALVAYAHDGAEIEPIHGGPVRIVVPHLYFWKSAKWVRGLRLRERDELGFWEELGYHERGDPWREQRYRGDP